MSELNSSLSRRIFCQKSTLGIGSALCSVDLLSKNQRDLKIPLGFDNFSIRALGWNAEQLLDYAQKKEVNCILFSDLGVYQSFDKNYLSDLRKEASNHDILIHAGTGGICPTSNSFKSTYGSAVEHLRLLINVAKNLGSSVARCYLGNMRDRIGKGGIERHIKETIRVLKSVKNEALDAGVTIAVENHAGDMHSLELVDLIERAGPEYVGATIDSGNATWTLENPIDTLRNLAPYAVSSGIRDSMVWNSKKGISVQWTSMGKGCIDLKTFASEWKRLCPKLPMQLETISGFSKEFPILEKEFWSAYSNISARDLSQFLLLARNGEKIKSFNPPKDKDRKEAQKEYQLIELENSLEYCKQVLGIGTSKT